MVRKTVRQFSFQVSARSWQSPIICSMCSSVLAKLSPSLSLRACPRPFSDNIPEPLVRFLRKEFMNFPVGDDKRHLIVVRIGRESGEPHLLPGRPCQKADHVEICPESSRASSFARRGGLFLMNCRIFPKMPSCQCNSSFPRRISAKPSPPSRTFTWDIAFPLCCDTCSTNTVWPQDASRKEARQAQF